MRMVPDEKQPVYFILTMYLVYFCVFITLGFGWAMNVMTIWHTSDLPLTAKFILRVVGIFVFPIGGILGFIQ